MITWQWLFARAAGARINWPEVYVVGASVWLSYAADRWIEGWRLTSEAIRTPRHRFYHQHRWPVAVVWIAVVVTDVSVAFAELTHRELIAGVILLTPTLLYLFSHQLVHRHHPWRLPKELCVAGLIAGGSSVFVLARSSVPLALMVLPVLLFAALCFSNVALIAAWEEEVDVSHGQESLARRFRHVSRLSRGLPLLLMAGAIVATLAWPARLRAVGFCVAASALLLLILDRTEGRMGRQLARVLADVVLLTPILLLAGGAA